MKKFTRKFYNKKLVALGLSAFMGIGLISTGFAAWVMSKDANTTPSGNVNVAVITDSSAQIVLTGDVTGDVNSGWTLNDAFSFDAPTNDNQGRIRFGGAGKGEDLEVTITGQLTGNEGVDYDLIAQLVEYPQAIKDAIQQEYLEWYSEDTNYTTAKPLSMDAQGNFSMTIRFKWGAKFGWMNPSKYYDEHEDGKKILDDVMNAELQAFHKVISAGLTAKQGDETIENYSGVFKVTLTATPTVEG